MHKPIQIQNLSLSFSHKICFEHFNAQVIYGQHIAIIGRNGSGKTSLLNVLQGILECSCGDIKGLDNLKMGFVPQSTYLEKNALSGAQHFNAALTSALSLNPDILLLDEPTNHLDKHNRKTLMRYLKSYTGTFIVISHDTELLRHCVDTFWHIDNHEINVFSGSFDDYLREQNNQRISIERELNHFGKQKKEIHEALMKEQKRASKSHAKGEKSINQKKWPTIVSSTKASRASNSAGRKKAAIEHQKQTLMHKLSELRLPEIILPKFSLEASNLANKVLVSIYNASIGYPNKPLLIENFSLYIEGTSRIAIQGDNASGKSTLIKAILGINNIIKQGEWNLPSIQNMGYLDQHYHTLSCDKTVYETISELTPNWSHIEVRRYLNDFLFRTNDEVNHLVSKLSGGERVRLCLAQIGAKTPKLLILDEITNNLDLETKTHVIQVLKAYPGAMIIISHDTDFLEAIELSEFYEIQNKALIKIK